MKHFAQLRGEDSDLWEAVGLLHDMDYERHPNLERSPTDGHSICRRCVVTRERLEPKKCAVRFFRTPITQAFRAERLSKKLSTQWMS